MPQLDIRYFFPSAFFAFLIFCFIYFLLRRLVLPYFFTLFFIRRKLISFITGSTLKAQEMSFKVQNSVTITTRNLLKLLVDAQILVFEELALLTYTRLLNVVSMLVPQERFLIEFFV